MRSIAAKTVSATSLAAVLLSALLWLDGLQPAQAGINVWTPTGPGGGPTRALAVDPLTSTTLYAGTSQGVFKSTDSAGSWSAVNAGLTNLDVQALAIDLATPTTLYAGTWGGGIFKSIDGGSSWSAGNTGLTDLFVQALAVDPLSPTSLYAGTKSGGAFKSTDGGGAWSAINAGLTKLDVEALAIDPQTPTTIYAATSWGGGIFKSTDGGVSWRWLTSSPFNALAIDPVVPTTIYAGSAFTTGARGGSVFKSTDGGENWSAANTGLTDSDNNVRALVIDPLNPTTLYAGMSEGVFKSAVGGGSWSAANTGLNVGRRVEALVIDPLSPSTLYAGTSNRFSLGGGGVFKTTDGGGTWSGRIRLQYRSANADVYYLAIDPQTPTTLYAGTDGGGVYKSLDAGGSWGRMMWTSWCDPCTASVLAIDPQISTTLYAVIDGGGIYKSTNGGSGWSRLTTPITGHVWALAIDPQTSTTLYAGTDAGVFKSTNSAGSWSATSLTSGVVLALAVDPLTPTTVYAGTRDGGVFKSADGGGTWSPSSSGLTDLRINALAIDPRTPTTVYAGTDGGVFQSTDGGGSWSALNSGLTNLLINTLAIDPQIPTIIYAGTAGGGVFSLQQQSAPENHAPVADAGPDQIVEAADADGAAVTLDGSRSSDPDGDPLTFTWSWPTGTASGVCPSAGFPIGMTTVTLVVSDSQGATGSDTVQITVRDSTPPSVAVTSPGDGATVSGTITVTASASDTVGVAGVQFLLDDAPLGAEDTSTPYEVPWDTRTVPDGTHRLAARARDAAGNTTTSATVTVTVANGPVPTVTLARPEETAATLAPSGAWSEITSAGAGVALSGDRAVFASGAAATATFTFTGTGVRWIGVPCEVCGVADVRIDGSRVATVDTFARSRPAASTAMYTGPRLSVGGHTLVIAVTGTANTASGGAFVVVDAFDVTLDGAGLLPPISVAPTSVLGVMP